MIPVEAYSGVKSFPDAVAGADLHHVETGAGVVPLDIERPVRFQSVRSYGAIPSFPGVKAVETVVDAQREALQRQTDRETALYRESGGPVIVAVIVTVIVAEDSP